MKRVTGGAEAGWKTRRGKFRPEKKAVSKGKNQQRQQEGEFLVSKVVFHVRADGTSNDESASHAKSRECEPSLCPIPQRRADAVNPVKQLVNQLHFEFTIRDLRAASTFLVVT
jgi:hypothetical protein